MDADPQKRSAVHETGVADLYAILALLLQFPTTEIVNGIADGSVQSDLSAMIEEANIPSLLCGKAFEDLANLQHDLNENKTGYEEIRRERTRLFDHPDHPVIRLYEGVFIDEERVREGMNSTGARIFVNPAALDAERCYRKAGVKRASDINIPADCITTELEFMSHLHALKAKALINEDAEALKNTQGLLDEFTHFHVSKWFYRFFERCTQESLHPLFCAIGIIGTALIETQSAGATA